MTCQLIHGSIAKGCLIRISGNHIHGNFLWEVNRPNDSISTASNTIGPIPPGTYEVSLFDFMKNGCHNDYLEVFKASLTVKALSSTTLTVISMFIDAFLIFSINIPFYFHMYVKKNSAHTSMNSGGIYPSNEPCRSKKGKKI